MSTWANDPLTKSRITTSRLRSCETSGSRMSKAHPPTEVFRLIKKFHPANEYRREVQDVALLTVIAKLKALKRASGA